MRRAILIGIVIAWSATAFAAEEAEGKEPAAIRIDPALEGETWLIARAGETFRRGSPAPLFREVLSGKLASDKARQIITSGVGLDQILSRSEILTWLYSWDFDLLGFVAIPPESKPFRQIKFPADAAPGKIHGTAAVLRRMGEDTSSKKNYIHLLPLDARLMGSAKPTDLAAAYKTLNEQTLERLEKVAKEGGFTAKYAREDIQRIRKGEPPALLGPGDTIWQELCREATLKGLLDATDLAPKLEKAYGDISVKAELSAEGAFTFEDVRPGRYVLYYPTDLILFLYYVELPPGGDVEVRCLLPLEIRKMQEFMSGGRAS